MPTTKSTITQTASIGQQSKTAHWRLQPLEMEHALGDVVSYINTTQAFTRKKVTNDDRNKFLPSPVSLVLDF